MTVPDQAQTRRLRLAPPGPEQSAYEQAMDEWVALFANRDEMAVEYATCLRDLPPEWDRWNDLNAAILRRWSMAGLRYIKTKAWAL